MKQRKEFSGVDGQLSAFGGDEKPLVQPFKKQHVIFLFHFPYGAADGGLGDVQLFGGFAHAACFGYGKENFQMSQCHVDSSFHFLRDDRFFPMSFFLFS